MLLSKQQEYILEVLGKLGCLRREQLLVLVREKFRQPDLVISQERVDAMLRQLRTCTSAVYLDDDLVMLGGATPLSIRLEAIDVMLELTHGAPKDFHVDRQGPDLLQFSLEEDLVLRLFTVMDLTDNSRPADVERRKMERIIWISESGKLPSSLELPPKHFFAVRLEDGTHRFCGSVEP